MSPGMPWSNTVWGWGAACSLGAGVVRGGEPGAQPEYGRKGPSGVVSGPVDVLARSRPRSAVGGLVAPSYSILGLLAAASATQARTSGWLSRLRQPWS